MKKYNSVKAKIHTIITGIWWSGFHQELNNQAIDEKKLIQYLDKKANQIYKLKIK